MIKEGMKKERSHVKNYKEIPLCTKEVKNIISQNESDM